MEIKAKPLEFEFAKGKLGKRDKDAHKGSFGRVLIVAGSSGMAGAAYLSAFAALRTGSGLVYIATTPENIPILQGLIPEAICLTHHKAMERLDTFDAVAIGPGIGMAAEMMEFFMEILGKFDGPRVIDADGLNLLAKLNSSEEDRDTIIRLNLDENTLLTPHMGEAERLLDRRSKFEEFEPRNRMKVLTGIQKEFGTSVLLKGNGTLIGKGEDIYINTTGNPGMATAGSGDVLTGICASLMGQGHSAFESGLIAAFLHRLAGDIGSEKLGTYSLMARDIIDCLPYAIKQCVEK